MDAEFREEYEKIGAILGITRVLSRLLNVGETCETLKHSSDLIEEVPLPRHFARQPAANLAHMLLVAEPRCQPAQTRDVFHGHNIPATSCIELRTCRK